MELRHTLRIKMLLTVVPALLCALILQPATALAEQYTVTYITDGNGVLTRDNYDASTFSEIAEKGVYLSNVPTPKANPGYTFDGWTANIAAVIHGNAHDAEGFRYSTDEMQKLSVDKNVTFTAHFKAPGPYTITYLATYGGSVSVSSEVAEEGSNPVGAEATPSPGYEFAFWRANEETRFVARGDSSSSTGAPSCEFSADDLTRLLVERDIELTAYFRQIKYTFKYTTDGNGTVNTDSEVVEKGNYPVKISDPIPNTGYEFDYWTVDVPVLVASGWRWYDSYDVGDHLTTDQVKLIDQNAQMFPTDVTLKAHFKEKYYTVTYASSEHGSVSPDSEQVQESYLPTATLTVTPNTGYKFDYWTADTAVTLEEAASNAATTIKKGDPITDKQRKQIKVTSSLTLTPHFSQIDADSDSTDPVEPTDSDDASKIKPADGTATKVLPKTGDVLPAVSGAVACAACAAVAAGFLGRRWDY